MKRVLDCLIVFILSLFVTRDYIVKAVVNSNIPNEAIEWNGHYYMYYDNNFSWDEAKIFCESIGGHLATISSEEENLFLYYYLSSLGYQNAYFGLTDEGEESEWRWVTNEPFLYSNWHSGEPNTERSSENYAMFYRKYTDATWNDGNFGNGTDKDGTGFLCERDAYNEVKYNLMCKKLVGTHKGTYIAKQGLTGLILEIYKEDNMYKANFKFYSVAGNPNVETGEYLINISFDYNSELF